MNYRLAHQYKELRRSQEKEKQIMHQSRALQKNNFLSDENYQRTRIAQINQLMQSRQNYERATDQKISNSLLKVRQQLLQIDYIRRNSQRDAFERMLKHEHSLLLDLKLTNQQTVQKSKYLSSLHDQLYTIRTQQDLSEKRHRDMSLHSQI